MRVVIRPSPRPNNAQERPSSGEKSRRAKENAEQLRRRPRRLPLRIRRRTRTAAPSAGNRPGRAPGYTPSAPSPPGPPTRPPTPPQPPAAATAPWAPVCVRHQGLAEEGKGGGGGAGAGATLASPSSLGVEQEPSRLSQLLAAGARGRGEGGGAERARDAERPGACACETVLVVMAADAEQQLPHWETAARKGGGRLAGYKRTSTRVSSTVPGRLGGTRCAASARVRTRALTHIYTLTHRHEHACHRPPRPDLSLATSNRSLRLASREATSSDRMASRTARHPVPGRPATPPRASPSSAIGGRGARPVGRPPPPARPPTSAFFFG